MFYTQKQKFACLLKRIRTWKDWGLAKIEGGFVQTPVQRDAHWIFEPYNKKLGFDKQLIALQGERRTWWLGDDPLNAHTWAQRIVQTTQRLNITCKQFSGKRVAIVLSITHKYFRAYTLVCFKFF